MAINLLGWFITLMKAFGQSSGIWLYNFIIILIFICFVTYTAFSATLLCNTESIMEIATTKSDNMNNKFEIKRNFDVIGKKMGNSSNTRKNSEEEGEVVI